MPISWGLGSWMNLPPEETERVRVVTVGGGHGQAALLAGLSGLCCDVTALVSVADDGGCSGRLRDQFGMPPPGDLRRCLTTLARHRALAERFDERIKGPDETMRSAGNLALFEAYQASGSLQAAVDWAAGLLACRGRVVPVSEAAGKLAVYDRGAGVLEGETVIEERASSPMVVAVHGADVSNPAALAALHRADFIFLGPGSFITSTLAALTTATIAGAVSEASARMVMVHNLAPEAGQTEYFALSDYVRMLRDHLCIASGRADFALTVLSHGHAATQPSRLEDGTCVVSAPLATPGVAQRHEPTLIADALATHFGFARSIDTDPELPSDKAQIQAFEEHLARALVRASAAGA